MYDLALKMTDDSKANKAKRKILPTPRIAFGKQLDLLRAFAAASGPEKRPVGNADTSQFVGLSASTVSLANPFFADVGLIERVGGGFVPSKEVVNFAQAFEWDADGASRELGPVFENSWFGSALLPRLGFASLPEKEALQIIDGAAEAGLKYKNHLRILLDYLEVAGLIQRQDGTVRTAPRPANNGRPAENAADAEPSEAPPKPSPSVPEGSRSLPLLIQGLLQELPRGSSWNREAADRWLNLAKLTFEMVYEFEPEPPSPQPSDEMQFPAGEKAE
jgi:hypothetical protein